ncbi:MAG: YncE family protein [Gemmatimonadota bacterium]
MGGGRRLAVGLTLAAALTHAGCGGDAWVSRLYVTSGFTDQVFVLDAATGALLDSIDVDLRPGESDEPHGIAIAPDGERWYVTLSHGEPTLWAFEAAGDRLVGRLRLDLPGASRVRITPDGQRAFIPDYYRSGMGAISGISVVDLDALTVAAELTVCAAPHDAAVSPDGALVAIACSLSDEVVLLDASSFTERVRVTAGDAPGSPGTPRYRPLNVTWLPDGSAFFVGMHAADEVVRFARDGTRGPTVATGPGPAQLAITPGGLLLIPHRMDGTLSVLDARTLREQARIPLGGAHPHGIAVSSDGGSAWLTLEGEAGTAGTVVAVDLVDLSVRWRRDLGGYLLGIAVREPSGGAS